MTVDECAGVLCCKPRDLVRWRRRGQFPPVFRDTDAGLVVDRAVFLEWLNSTIIATEGQDELQGRFR